MPILFPKWWVHPRKTNAEKSLGLSGRRAGIDAALVRVWICSSRVRPPSEIKSNFKIKTLRWRSPKVAFDTVRSRAGKINDSTFFCTFSLSVCKLGALVKGEAQKESTFHGKMFRDVFDFLQDRLCSRNFHKKTFKFNIKSLIFTNAPS